MNPKEKAVCKDVGDGQRIKVKDVFDARQYVIREFPLYSYLVIFRTRQAHFLSIITDHLKSYYVAFYVEKLFDCIQ
jgi:hypothetical protein